VKPVKRRRLNPTEALTLALALAATTAAAQPQRQLADGIIAVVGEEPVLYSDLAGRLEQARQGGERVDDALACSMLEDIMYEKLLLDQARIDSVEVDEAQVDAELDQRIRYFIAQLGSEQKLEEFYGKSITTIKAEFRERVRDQMLTGQMQDQVVGDSRATPRDVEKFFNTIPKDSLPLINAQVEFSQIVKAPRPGEEEVRRVRKKLEEFRTGLADGSKDFCVLATLYSEDPGSKDNCGELGMVAPGTMVPTFDAVALSLKDGEVSQVFETEYGYHIMRMIERRGEQYNAQHILIKPRTTDAEQQLARAYLDSMANEVRLGRADFAKVAGEVSDDEESKAMNGAVVQPSTNSTRWAMGELDQQDFFVIDKLKAGEVSDPVSFTLPDGTKALRIVRLNLRTEPHVANLKDDYQLLQRAAENKMKETAVSDWARQKIQETYVRIGEGYTACTFKHPWVAPRP